MPESLACCVESDSLGDGPENPYHKFYPIGEDRHKPLDCLKLDSLLTTLTYTFCYAQQYDVSFIDQLLVFRMQVYKSAFIVTASH